MIKINGLTVKSFKFSGGEVNPRLPEGLKAGDMNIIAWLQSSDNIMELLLVIDAIQHKFGIVDIYLTIPYFPYARQDRVCSIGEAIGLDVMAKLLPQNLRGLKVYDLHNENRKMPIYTKVDMVKQLDIARIVDPGFNEHTILVAPDAGAIEKTKEIAEFYDVPWILCVKHRDPETGQLSGFGVDTQGVEAEGKHLLVVDDICDGGGTFLGLGAELWKLKPKSLSLYVTHGLFSKGFVELLQMYNNIYTTDTINRTYPSQIKVFDIVGKPVPTLLRSI